MNKYIKRIVISLAALFGLALVAIGIYAFMVYEALKTERDPDEYSVIINNWESHRNLRSLVEHFPNTLDDSIKVIEFAAQPGFLQGGSFIQLRIQYSSEKINNLYREFNSHATKIFIGGDRSNHINQKNGMPTTDFYTSDDQDNRVFPNDYEIMIFDKVIPIEESSGGFWNHGQSHGVAITKKRNEVVYWAESW